MFDSVAQNYDRTNDLLSFGQDRLWRRAVKKTIEPFNATSIFDLAAGTGASTAVFVKPGVRVVAGDFSEGMLAVGRKRHPQIDFVFADATKLPFADNEFDVVTISFGLRNVVDPQLAMREMLRVLTPGGHVVICEFSHLGLPVIGSLYRFYLSRILPALSRIGSKTPEAYIYLAESIAAWPNQKALAAQLQTAGFENVSYRNLSFGVVAIHVGQKSVN